VASSFDEFVLGCDPVLVGACTEYAGDDPVASMLDRWAGSLRAQGVDPSRITVEADRREALRAALDRARAGDLVVLLADWHEARDVIDHWRGDSGTT
jgi:UDP-N-acetylmuramyl tripeptide synthase